MFVKFQIDSGAASPRYKIHPVYGNGTHYDTHISDEYFNDFGVFKETKW